MSRTKFSKLGNVYLKEVNIDLNFYFKNSFGEHNIGEVKYKIGKFGRTKKAKYIFTNNNNSNERNIDFIYNNLKDNNEIPTNQDDKNNLLLMVYSKIGEMQYFLELKKKMLEKEIEVEEQVLKK